MVHGNNKNKRLSRVQNEVGNLMHHDEQELFSVWEGWHWDDNTGGWLDPELCARARREEVEYIRLLMMEIRVSRETCLRETGRAPIKTGWAKTDKGQSGKPNVRSEIATGKRGGKVVALVDVRRRVFVELPPEDYQPGDEHMCGLLQKKACMARATPPKNLGEELTSTHSDLKLTRCVACPCVWRGHIKGEHVVATVHGDDTTIGGERSAVEILIRKISKKCEIEKQVIGEDADLEKSERLFNRVTVTASQLRRTRGTSAKY